TAPGLLIEKRLGNDPRVADARPLASPSDPRAIHRTTLTKSGLPPSDLFRLISSRLPPPPCPAKPPLYGNPPSPGRVAAFLYLLTQKQILILIFGHARFQCMVFPAWTSNP